MFEHASALYIANVAQRTFEIVQNSRSFKIRDHARQATWSTSPETPTCEVPSYILRKLRADVVYDNGVVEKSLRPVCTGETSI